MTEKFPNLPSDELAMLATVEAASNAGQLQRFSMGKRPKAQTIRLNACLSLVNKGWILGGIDDTDYVFYTEHSKVFKPTPTFA